MKASQTPTKRPILSSGGVKTRQPATRQQQPSVRPTTAVTPRPVATTSRPSLIDEDDDEENELPAKKVPSPQPKKPTILPSSGNGSSGTKGKQKQQTTVIRPSVNTAVETTGTTTIPMSPIKKMILQSTKRPLLNQPTPIGGTKTRITPQPGTKSKQAPTKISPRPVITTSRPSLIEEDDESEQPARATTQRFVFYIHCSANYLLLKIQN